MKRPRGLPSRLAAAFVSALLPTALASPTGAMTGGSLPLLPPLAPPPAARDPALPELPFLVPSPPEDAQAPPAAQSPPPSQGDEGAATNPFSSLVLPPPESAPQPPPPDVPAAPPEVPPPAPPEVVAPEVEPPAPPLAAPRTPLSVPINRLPRTLLGRTARTPTLLNRTLDTAADVQASRNPLAEVAAIRVPRGAPPTPSSLSTPGLEPLGTARTPLTLDADEAVDSLRERRVSFTAVVAGTGVMGTGVFRVADRAAPVLLSVGQALPDTDLVLTALPTYRAVFTQNDERHILPLTQ